MRPEIVDDSVMQKNVHTLGFGSINEMLKSISKDRDESFWLGIQTLPRTTKQAFGNNGAGEVVHTIGDIK